MIDLSGYCKMFSIDHEKLILMFIRILDEHNGHFTIYSREYVDKYNEKVKIREKMYNEMHEVELKYKELLND